MKNHQHFFNKVMVEVQAVVLKYRVPTFETAPCGRGAENQTAESIITDCSLYSPPQGTSKLI